MSDDTNIIRDGILYVRAKAAARKAGLVADYVSRMCRAGDVRAIRHAGMWYVNEESLAQFLRNQEAEYEKFRQQKSEEGKRLLHKGEIAMQQRFTVRPHPHLRAHVSKRTAARRMPLVAAAAVGCVVLLTSLGFALEGLRTEAPVADTEADTQVAAASWGIPFMDSLANATSKAFCLLPGMCQERGQEIAQAPRPRTQPAQPTQTTPSALIVPAASPAATNLLTLTPQPVSQPDQRPIQQIINRPVERVIETVRTVVESPPALSNSQYTQLSSRIDGLSRVFEIQMEGIAHSAANRGASSGGSGGSVTSVDASGGTTGLLFSGGPVTTSGTLTLSGTLAAGSGGTGTSSAPTYGQMLVGDGAGGYTLMATSTLGIVGAASSPGGSTGDIQFNNGGTFAADPAFSYDAAADRLAVPYASSTVLSAGTLCLGNDCQSAWPSGGANPFPGNATTTQLAFNGGLTAAGATTTNLAITNLPNALLATNANGTVVATTSLSSSLINTSGNWSGTFDGQEGGYYLANAFSTSSANYWKTQNNFFSTTSADYYIAQANLSAFSTTSADYWKSVNDFFSTSSAQYFVSVTDLFSTTSANFFAHSSTTIPKTYTSNVFSASQTFSNSSTTAASFGYASSTLWYGGGLAANCGGGSFLTWANGQFGCAADQTGGGGGADPFPGGATSTLLTFSNGLMAFGSSTIADLSATRATTTILAITSLPNALLATDANGTVYATTSLAASLVNTSGNWTGTLDGQEGAYYLANSFSTTSADYYIAQANLSAFSTTSADFWKTQRDFFSTTSANYWKSANDFFSTSSAQYFVSVTDLFSTTSANFFVGASTTIPKTYAANTFTGANVFLASTTIGNGAQAGGLTVSGGATTSGSLVVQSAATSSIPTLAVSNALNLFGTFANSLDDLCEAITGGSGLCDGTDNVGGGGGGLATSTNIADTWVVYGTSAGDVGAESAFTYDDAANLLTVANASTTLLSASYASSTEWWGGGLLATCDSGNVLTWNSGRFGCAADQIGGLTFAYPFPGNATTTALAFNGGLTTTNATSTNLAITNVPNALLATDANGTVYATTSLASSLISTSGNWSGTFDGQEGSYYLANGFSTTSANAWQATRNFFSTSSAQYFVSATDLFSTTSANFFVGASTTIPKTYANNTFTGNNTFTNASSSNFAITNLANALLSTNADGTVVATTSLGTNALSGQLATVNGTAINAGGTHTITAASSTLLADVNNWSALQTFSIIAASSATTTNLGITGLPNSLLATDANGTVYATTSIASNLINTSGNWTGTLDGQEGSYYLANGFSTTSAANFAAAGLAFSTTSNDFWQSQRNFFSTTSANFFAHSSTTIPKTYTANAFTGLQTFANASTTLGSFAYASSTLWYGGGLAANCDAGNVLTWANGRFGCATDQIGSTFGYLFPGNATTTQLAFNGGLTAANATTSNLAITNLANALLATDSTGRVVSTTTIGANLINTTGDWTGTLDGREGAYYLANAFSTTSADYWKTQNDFFSTTSAANFAAAGLAFSTTSSNYWKSVNDFFSTSSAQYFVSVTDLFSTTSANFFVGASTTIPKTYTSNTFTAPQAFSGGLTASYITATTSATSTLPHLAGSFLSGFGLSECEDGSDKLIWNNGLFGCGVDAGAGGGITSLGPVGQGQNGPTITLATSSSAFNGLTASTTITGSGNSLLFTNTLSGVLGAGGGGTGIANPSAAGILLGSYAGGGWQQLATSSLGLSSSDIAEGAKLFYTDARVQSFVSGSSTIPKTYTNNAFTGNNTFTNATTSNFAITNLANALLATDSSGTVVATTSLSANLINTSGNWTGTFDGQEGAYYLANGFSTTSADYFASQRNFFSTTSANYWKSVNDFFSTSSVQYFVSVTDLFSTTSANFFVHSSTTIPKTYSSNTFTSTNTFNGQTNLANASTTNVTASGLASTSQLVVSNGFTLANLTGFLKASAGVVASAAIDLANDVTGILGVNHGGTGWSQVAANAVVLGNGSGALATTTAGTNGQVLALVGGVPTWVATTTLANISGTLAVTNGGTGITSTPSLGQILVGNGSGTYALTATSSLGLPTQSDLAGYVPTSRTISTTYPLQGGGDLSGNRTLSLAFGTTTANAWSAQNTFTSLFAANASSTNATTTNLHITGLPGALLATDANGRVFSTTTIASNLINTSGNWTGTFDGLEGAAYLANSFSTTSADFWKTQRDFFSTTSAQYFVSVTDLFSTTSAISFVHSSTTIPKTYTANAFTAGQTFSGGATTTNLGITSVPNALLATRADGSVYATTSLASGLISTSGNWGGTFDGQEGSYYLANSFSTTSAANFAAAGLAFSTTSSDYWQTQRNFFSTTSANYWKSVNDFFSTSSAQYFVSVTDLFSTTSANFFVHSSTTIPKTYASNTFTGANTFASGLLSVGSTTISGNATTTGMQGVGSLFINNERITDLTGTGLTNSGGALTLNATGNWTGTFDGQEGSFYLANSFSTSSADFWKTQNNFFSTTSASHFLSLNQGAAFSTTSANYWETQQTARTADNLGDNSIEDLSDVAAMTENYGDLLFWNGASWADIATSSLGLPTFGDLAGFSNFAYLFPGNATTTQLAFNGGLTATNATSSNFGITNVPNALLATRADGSVYATTSIASGLVNTSGNWTGTFDGLEGAAYLANSFSTTSANFWKGQNNFFSTSSAQYFVSVTDLFSTTSANFFVGASTTIPKTYANNTFTGANMFLASTTIGNGTQGGGLTISGGATTTGPAYFGGPVGIGVSPSQWFQVRNDTNGASEALFENMNSGNAAASRVSLCNDASSCLDANVYSSGHSASGFAGANFASLLAGAGVAQLAIGTEGTAPLLFATDNAERMRLASSGNLGIGTTSPYAKLSVVGQIVGANFTATTTAVNTFPTLLSTNATTTNLHITGLANALLATDGNGRVFATTSINAASSTLLADSNRWTGANTFNAGFLSVGSTTVSGNATTTGMQGVGSLFINSERFTDLTGSGLTISSNSLTVDDVTPAMLQAADFGEFTCNGTTCSLDAESQSIEEMSDVAAMTKNFGDLLMWNGTTWTDVATSSLAIALSNTTGTLGATRGGTGLSTITNNQLLIGGAGNTIAQVATSSLGLPTFADLAGFSNFAYLFPGNATTTGLVLAASTTIGNGGQNGGLTISGGATTTGNLLVQGSATTTNLAVTGTASTTRFYGAGLTDCDADTAALGWDASTGKFVCGDDDAGAGGDAGFGVEAVRVFTSSGTWTKPAFVNNVFVEVWGPGAGGGTGAANNSDGGGGSGGYSASTTAVSGNVSVVVGTGGASNSTAVAGQSRFPGVATITANGGTGTSNTTGGAGATTTSTFGTIALVGQQGGNGKATDGAKAGDGGSAPRGGAGGIGPGGSNSGETTVAGRPGIVPGGGGSGGEGAGAGGAGANGMVVVWEFSGTNGSDLAEMYETKENVAPGDVVAISKEITEYESEWGLQKVSVLEKATRVNNGHKVVGVVSTAPNISMGRVVQDDPNMKNPQPIALAGRVPVKASLEGGPIKAGDLLGPSSIPGVAMRTDKAGEIIGWALEDYVPPDAASTTPESTGPPPGRVMMFVHTGYSSGAKTNAILSRAGMEADTIPAELDIGRIMLAQLVTEKRDITATTSISEVFTDRVIAGLEIITPRVLTDTLVVNAIEPVDKSIGIRLLEDGKLNIWRAGEGTLSATFGTASSSDKLAVSIDALGNAMFAGGLTVGSAEKPAGMTLYDEETGSPYCVKVKGGKLVTLAGTCATAQLQEGAVAGTSTSQVSDSPPADTSTSTSSGDGEEPSEEPAEPESAGTSAAPKPAATTTAPASTSTSPTATSTAPEPEPAATSTAPKPAAASTSATTSTSSAARSTEPEAKPAATSTAPAEKPPAEKSADKPEEEPASATTTKSEPTPKPKQTPAPEPDPEPEKASSSTPESTSAPEDS